MLSFFKSKPKLSSLIPSGYTDIHSHLLPGIDDGAKKIEDTVLFLQTLQKLGFRNCILTPHTLTGIWDNNKQSILDNWEMTKSQVPLTLRDMMCGIASEYMLDDTILSLVAKETLLCLKAQYLLVEMSYLQPPLAMIEILFELKLKGYIPVLAHPERYLYLQQDIKTMERIKADGCLFQLNLLSVTGYYGHDVAVFAEQLLMNNFIDFTGSDIHHLQHIEGLHQPLKIKAVDQLEKAMRSNEFFSS